MLRISSSNNKMELQDANEARHRERAMNAGAGKVNAMQPRTRATRRAQTVGESRRFVCLRASHRNAGQAKGNYLLSIHSNLTAV